jgi:hypothetical protein
MRSTIMILALAAAGCQYDPYAHEFTTAKPDPAALAGIYRLKEQTVAPGGLTALGGKECKVDLRDDGTFVATHVPPFSAEQTGPSLLNRLVSGQGRWRVESVGAVSDGQGPARTHWGIRLESESEAMMAPGLKGDGPPYGLIFTIGDPDAGQVLILEKAG